MVVFFPDRVTVGLFHTVVLNQLDCFATSSGSELPLFTIAARLLRRSPQSMTPFVRRPSSVSPGSNA